MNSNQETQNEDQLPPGTPYYLRPNELQRKMNRRMAELIPELDSRFSRAPIARYRWYSPMEEYEENVPCYIPTYQDSIKEQGKAKDGRKKKEMKMKKDYVWMPRRKDLPEGYYHLATQEAYIEIYHLFRTRRTRRFGPFKNLFKQKVDKKRAVDMQSLDSEINDLLYNRLITDKPDDVYAQRMKLFLLRSEAGRNKAFAKAAYLPALTTAVLSGATGL